MLCCCTRTRMFFPLRALFFSVPSYTQRRAPTFQSIKIDIDKLRQIVPDTPEFADMGANFDAFEDLFAQYIKEHASKINWNDIKPPPADMVRACVVWWMYVLMLDRACSAVTRLLLRM